MSIFIKKSSFLFIKEENMVLLFIIEGDKMHDFKENRNGFNLKEVIAIIVITAIVTSLTTGVIVYNQNKLSKNITYHDLNNDTALKEFLGVYASLIDEYYEDVDKTAMLESALSAMFNYLGEDYSTYMNKEETDALAQRLIGEYKGIGITINNENTIVDLFEGGPAKEVGMQEGDKIIAINGQVIDNETNTQISEVISSFNIGDKITITVSRENENINFEVMIKKLFIPAVDYRIEEENIGYLKIATFSNTLKEQVNLALKEMESKGISSLIIDLRNNTGGYLSASKEVASLFLEKDKVIYSLEEKDGTTEYKDETDEKREYKIVVLFNEGSASASEVLIAALKESYGAITIGTKSYGKGKVQQTYSLEDGSMVKYTSAKWLTPNGTCIDNVGIIPDYVVELDKDNLDVDNQLERAIELAK